MTRSSIVAVALAMLMAWTGASASVVVAGTRVVYPSDSRDVSIRLTNNGETPALVQSWVDAGDTNIKPEDLNVPFSVSPSIFRLDPTKVQIMRLVFLGASLPQDRESLYWLNVLEIPPRPTALASENYLQFAIKSRLKIFYRPASLKAQPGEALKTLKWSPAAGSGDEVTIRVENPSPFYVSFAEVRTQLADGTELPPINGMVVPFGTETLKFKRADRTSAAPAKIFFKTVDDYGSFVDGSVDLR